MNLRLVALAIVTSLTFASSVASAEEIQWRLQDVAFADGGTATGSFVYDTEDGTVSDLNITLAASGPYPAETFTTRTGPFNGIATLFTVTQSGSSPGEPFFYLDLADGDFSSEDEELPLDQIFAGSCNGTMCTNYQTERVGLPGGTISRVPLEEQPEPIPTMSEWAMILLGLTLAGGAALAIQRKRLQA